MDIRGNNNRSFCSVFYKKKVVAFLSNKHETSFFKKLDELFMVNGRNFRHMLSNKREAVHDKKLGVNPAFVFIRIPGFF